MSRVSLPLFGHQWHNWNKGDGLDVNINGAWNMVNLFYLYLFNKYLSSLYNLSYKLTFINMQGYNGTGIQIAIVGVYIFIILAIS
jgi:hypothetical protein